MQINDITQSKLFLISDILRFLFASRKNNEMETNNKISAWSDKNITKENQIQKRHWPSEVLLRTFFSSSYFRQHREISEGMKLLDIGCLHANNLAPFQNCKLDLYGTEVNSGMVELSIEACSHIEINADIRLGTNRKLPFDDNFFDIVISLNTIHYEDNQNDLNDALSEFHRVGNDNCEYLIGSVGANHRFHRTAQRLAVNQYLLTVEDFRKGQIMSYFDSADHMLDCLSTKFSSVEIVTTTESWPSDVYEFYFAKCIK